MGRFRSRRHYKVSKELRQNFEEKMMTRKLNTFFHNTNDLVDENHSSEEYAERQKQRYLEKAGKIDVEGFMKQIKEKEDEHI